MFNISHISGSPYTWRMGRRSEHSRDELRALILDATVALVREQGAQVTARQIAAAIGYTPGMLYSVFVNLQDIFLHVNAMTLDTLYQRCRDASQASDSPAQALQSMASAYLGFADAEVNRFDLLFTRWPDRDTPPPDVLAQRIRSLFALVEQCLGELAPGSDAETRHLAARALWSGVHGATALHLNDQLYLDPVHTPQDIVASQVTRFLDSWQAT